MSRPALVITLTSPVADMSDLAPLKHLDPSNPVALVVPAGLQVPNGLHPVIAADQLWSSAAVTQVLAWFASSQADHLLWLFSHQVEISDDGIQRLMATSDDTQAAITYGDFFEKGPDGRLTLHPLIAYQPGSIRDDFALGQVCLLSRHHLDGLQIEPDLNWCAWYDLRLKLSERGPIHHLPEPVCQASVRDSRTTGQKIFDYVDPANRAVQLEAERVATVHLKRIRAFLPRPAGTPLQPPGTFPCKASVIIPVKNRVRTIADAVRSALSQKAPFDFNVIVIDNHSTDGTTRRLVELARKDVRLLHLVPERLDLGIGGCWNQAVFSKACGEIAVQLDSDDLYAGTDSLARLVAAFDVEPVALVIGAYTTVDFGLHPLPPGLVDHREWTADNGHNNALRLAGLGAPRAFHVPTLRTVGFPNVSYGEDYAVALRLCRSHAVGRIYDSLYWCRRWEENTDSALSVEVKNRYDLYKDRIRTAEILARQRLSVNKP